jgi:PQQ enzyme repeat domain protein
LAKPIKEILIDAKIYEFKGFCVRMSSPFMMKCKEILGGAAINGEIKYENLNANVPRKEQSAKRAKNDLASKA